jgi:hypothetical protein
MSLNKIIKIELKIHISCHIIKKKDSSSNWPVRGVIEGI